MGSGRSGTTMLATVLNSSSFIHTAGELHQFYTYVKLDAPCSCGKKISECEYWAPIKSALGFTAREINTYESACILEEKHYQIPFLLLGKKPSANYSFAQEKLFTAIRVSTKKTWILDSSKYIARYLLLKKNATFSLAGVYMVRDVRGVIHSFTKNVQTKKKPISTLIYYILTNFFAQLVCWLNKSVIKIKYENFIENPKIQLEKISKLLDRSTITINETEAFTIPHIIGGNRLKQNDSLTIKKDEDWKKKMPRYNQILYYIICLPFMLLNGYKI